MSILRSCRRSAAAAASSRAGWLALAGWLLVAAGLAAGCRRQPRPSTAIGPVSPAFSLSFDGWPAGIQVGPGWYRPESDRDGRYAWTNRVVEVYFAPPPFGDAELVAHLHAFAYRGSAPQTVAVMLNQHPIGTFPVSDYWFDLHVPLPARALVSPVNALVMRFDHAAVPVAVGEGGDGRPIAAQLDRLVLRPRADPAAAGRSGDAAAAPADPATPSVEPRRPHPGRPDVFVYLIDALRADALGAYGARLPVSPRIDAFAREAVVLDQARSPAPWTLPATFSVLSGSYPFHHGVHVPGDRLARRFRPWLPELFRRAGYETLGISQWMLGGDAFGLEQGFDAFFLNLYQDGKAPSPAALWFLDQSLRRPRRPDLPLFAFLHTVAPHAPYEPAGDDRRFADARPGTLSPDQYDPQLFLAHGLGQNPADVAHLRGLYDGEVRAADRSFGAFLDLLRAAGLYDESIVVLVADHGEEFAEHGGFDHGRTLYDELLRVPLMIKLPRSAGIAPRRIAAPTSSLDLAPTLLAAIGRAPGALSGSGSGWDGTDLLPAFRAPSAADPPRTLYAETRVDKSVESEAVDLQAATIGDLKCIGEPSGKERFGRPVAPVRAYDLRRDPAERTPLPADSPEQARCQAELAHLAARMRAEAPGVVHKDVSPEEAARLKALGYLQ